ncbi:fungal-specific transcription factor domain-containing protein [Armillaria borealis]|uniref:Fungal-specific transcription factor domain-containing protein n=1 Tax=Armillaria borealis TaxID=47425 RepID=A0AA39JRG1_9AGAR|nr:fungal-specific transcription factor domain-containing protein [Armillaria borealis]
MPAEKTKLKRRASRREVDEFKFDGTHARELEQKRNRDNNQVSCAECRRLKIKCDKQIPCQSCQRRGCAALCPNGSLATGQGTRFVLAATEHLHRRIAKLSGRIRQLEDALSSLHSQHSTDRHPLLQDELIFNEEHTAEENSASDDATVQPPAEVIDAFGTSSLLIASSQTSPTSSAHSPDSKHASVSPTNSGHSTDFSLFSQSFPFTPMGRSEDVQDMIRTHLPPWERAQSLGETYFEQVAWIFRGVTRQQLIDDMLPAIYRKQPSEEFGGPHDLSLIFMIFAIGALVENEPSTESAHAEHYHQLSRAAISLQPVLEKPSIVTIQCLHLMSIYNAMSGSDTTSEPSMEMTWSLITLAAHLSQTVDRDSERWGLPAKMVQRRRILFWDLFVADVWQSLNTGRPPSFSLAYIDCSFPQYDDQKDGGSPGCEFEIWQFRFASECVAEVTARTLTAEAPSYNTIMELDRKVREFPLPTGMAEKNDLGTSFQRCVLDHIRETVLMYIHRSFFAQAIIEQPVNPLKSTYAPSFLAAYRSSATILKSVREQFTMWPNSCAKFWTMWTFAFSAAVVFGTVVTRGPRSPLATSAMAELEQACILFSKAATHSRRASKALPILVKLSEKARHALAAAQNEPMPLSVDKDGLLWNIKQEDADDELSIFAGHTRFVSAKRLKKSQRDFEPSASFSQFSDVGDGTQLNSVPSMSGTQVWSRQSSQRPPRETGTQYSPPTQFPQMYQAPFGSSSQPNVQPSNPALADLGLASRDSRLDERWSSFMQDSGLLDDVGFRSH